ncbi:MAG: queuosine precursor transporter [Saprospiraceae bacterium]|nr:queuosine precursor transporter [Saprospiraceae bacterium]
MKNQHKNKATRLFIILSAIFITNALIAEFIGVKIFSLERTLGLPLSSFNLFGHNDLSFQLTAGVLIWPVVFVMTDIINEYFGRSGVIRLSWLAIFMIAYAFLFVYLAIHLVPADFWPSSHLDFIADPQQKDKLSKEVSNYNTAFTLVFGQGLKIILASIVAFIIGQILDALIFHKIKLITGDRRIWLRATGSTLISQFFDSYIVLFIAFYFGANWPLSLVLAIGTVNYIYKVCMAIGLTPVIYVIHSIIHRYLGDDLSKELKSNAMKL